MKNIINVQILYDFLIILINEISFDSNQENIIFNEKRFRILFNFIKEGNKYAKLDELYNKYNKNARESVLQIIEIYDDNYDALKKYIQEFSFANISSLNKTINEFKENEADLIENIKNFNIIYFLKSEINKNIIDLSIIEYINNQNIYTRYFLTIVVNTILTLIFNIFKKKEINNNNNIKIFKFSIAPKYLYFIKKTTKLYLNDEKDLQNLSLQGCNYFLFYMVFILYYNFKN